MSRFLSYNSTIRRIVKSITSSQKSCRSGSRNYEPIVPVSLYARSYGLHSHCKFSGREPTSSALYICRESFYRCSTIRNILLLSLRSSMAYNAWITWKRLFQKCHFGGYDFPRINRIAQAVTLALIRTPLLIPGVFAFTGSQLAWAQKVVPGTGYIPSQDMIYRHARESHILMSSVIYAVYEGILLLLRAFYLALLFSPCVIMTPFADSLGPRFRKVWLRVLHHSLEKAGPAFIKWGQWAATRPDLFPRDLCAQLAELHTNAPKHSFAYTKKTVERAFGRKLSEIFDHFEEAPVASGSIAQVHRASLRFVPGHQLKPMVVAVKVRHPGVGESIRRDFAIINSVAKISTFIPTLKWLRLDESVQQFGVFMMSQVDLAREAAHLSRFIYNFRSWRDVSFPKPVYPLVHPAVLVETYEQGENVSHYVDELEGHMPLKSALAHIGTHALLKMLLVDNFIHADMHPGNILVRVGKNKPSAKPFSKSKPHVIFLDVGMTAELSKYDRINLLEFFKAVARRDGRAAAECTLRLSKRQNCPDPNAFIQEVKEAFDFWGTPEGDLVHPAECMQDLLEKVRHHKVNVDGNVTTVMVTTLVLEGWQRKLDPGYDVLDTLQTLLLRADWAKSLSYTIDGLMAP
ncbi:hypothetical protein SAY87_024626 [Trapa incisa]|uniref:ABC1 atypical kinase-like domain-containing protein n=1 Tax=Trapa incisa TaxID=236973 RepID=A0AAN7JG27_9MYRT|nr:hypothetical protein SAY87_024626 [Trapa incisa]